MTTEHELQPDIAIPPGEYLEEVVEELGISQAELARRMGRPAQAISEIINGTKAITPETAIQLEHVLGIDADFWLRLEQAYQLNKARLEQLNRLSEEVELLEHIPYTDMARCGWVPALRKAEERVREMLRFFRVASLLQVPLLYTAAFRKSDRSSTSSYALAAWLRKAEIEAATIDTAKFNVVQLRSALPKLRAFTNDPTTAVIEEARQLLAACGVALVILRHLPKTYANGATFWPTSGISKAIVLISPRGQYADIFWFTLFHELGHILLHGKREVFIEMNSSHHELDAMVLQQEQEANTFASDQLIPPQHYRTFVQQHPNSAEQVQQFAEQIGIAPGTVVGRLQHDGLLQKSHLNGLRIKYDWSNFEACGD